MSGRRPDLAQRVRDLRAQLEDCQCLLLALIPPGSSGLIVSRANLDRAAAQMTDTHTFSLDRTREGDVLVTITPEFVPDAPAEAHAG